MPDESVFDRFLTGLSHAEQDSLEAPFTYSQLAATVQQVAAGCSLGLDGLPFEFY